MVKLTFAGELASSDVFYPRQMRTLESVAAAFERSNIVAMVGEQGSGKSAVACELARRHDGVTLCLADYMAVIDQPPYLKWDERIFEVIRQALARTDFLILDDFTHWALLKTRTGLAEHARRQEIGLLRERVIREKKRLLLVGQNMRPTANPDEEDDYTRELIYGEEARYAGGAPTPLVHLSERSLDADDVASIAATLFGAQRAASIDLALVRLQAGTLSFQHWRWIAQALEGHKQPTAEDVLDVVERHILKGNVRMSEVEPLEFSKLPGTEAIAEALETHLVLPFENPQKAMELGLKAKRGVMLFGPPGTGKTSVGRALARRLGAKFFLIDGSLGTEPPHAFMARVRTIIEKARENAPAVLFIDDADLLFSIPHVAGLARQLLTILDGLESESASNICVMMTVMDAMKVPEALLRSGRVELWLEMSPPDEATRARMFARWAGKGLPEGVPIDFSALAETSERFTPADIRRVTEDAKLLHAADVAAGRASMSATHYLMTAVRELAETRNAMADTLGDPRLRLGAAVEGVAA